MAEHNRLTDEERGAGWDLLFDGVSTEHWRGFQREDFPAGWTVVDGTIHRADDAGDIITKEKYRDFEFKLDWRVEGSGNSGIMFRVSEDEDMPWRTGPEMQILNDDIHRDGKNPLTRAGTNYALHALEKEVIRPVGEWNEIMIRVQGPNVEHWINGERVVAYELFSDDWEQRVAESKFGAMPRYGREPEGHIDLQDHGDLAWFRNIKVRRL